MRRLVVHRVGLSPAGWLFVCIGTGPFAIAAYLVCRRAVWRTLIDSVWRVVGDGSYPVHVRRRRLIALRRNGLIGKPVFRACLKALKARYQPSPD
ncbi:hypothetical protein [Paraburkholderia sp. BCC1885]|uniref:hypothetical protein n=1 Tax=Paraburkholderia sp. BCC1885 TaxID=2562669 RepID=UPI001182B10E|nr:hypothetical protein [Paraburkholderia sp. BCC1885]